MNDWPMRFSLICILLAVCSTTTIRGDEPLDVVPSAGEPPRAVDFQRHVIPLLSRYGCSTANCHGSFQGRGGFRLSLFGHASQQDYNALVERVDIEQPDDSLILQKPTQQTDHEGGLRFEVGSWPYQVLRQWIAAGAPAPANDSLDHVTLVVHPPVIELTGDESRENVQVELKSEQGETENVTAFCRLESAEPTIAEVVEDGLVRRAGPGATHITIQFGGQFATVAVFSPFPPNPVDGQLPGNATRATEDNWIDALINRQLSKLHLAPAVPANDCDFLRRATLDTVGRLPTPEEILEFTADADTNKRSRVIDSLLADPSHAALWATRLCDMTGCRVTSIAGTQDLQRVRARMWHAWFNKRMKENRPFDELVRGVICGSSRMDSSVEQFIDREVELIRAAKSGGLGDYADREMLDLFWRRSPVNGSYPRAELAERIAAAFMGVRMQCAQCHKHPHDRWSQTDYAAFVNIFSHVSFGSSIELNRGILDHLRNSREARSAGEQVQPLPHLQEVFTDSSMAVYMHSPDTSAAPPAQAPGGPVFSATHDAREQFADWLTASDNPYFARNWVNRVWAHYFGKGFVEPVDSFSSMNAASHSELLDRLADEFIRSGYDMRWLERLILNSATYQRTAFSHASVSRVACDQYACARVRPLLAEVAVASLDQVLGVERKWEGDINPEGTLLQVGVDRPKDSRQAYLLELFGRGDRDAVCDCSRVHQTTLRQTLHLMSDSQFISEIGESSLVRDLSARSSVDSAVDELFLRTYSRLPTAEEKTNVAQHVRAASEPLDAWTDLVWVMINSREFRTNH